MIYLLSVDHLLSVPQFQGRHVIIWSTSLNCSLTNLKIGESLLTSLFTFSLISIYKKVCYEQMGHNKLKKTCHIQ